MTRVVTLVVAAAFALGCGNEPPPAAEPEVVREGEVVTVASERVPVFEWASGAVASARQTTVASRVLATIVDVPVRAGAEVAVGDTLVVLDARDLAAHVQEANQVLSAARAQLALAQREADRVARLVSEGVGTIQQSDRASAALRVARAEVEKAQQGLEAAEVAQSHSDIRSPVAGRVVDRLAEPGETATPGRPLLRIYDPSVLRVEVPVRESLAVKLAIGQRLPLEVEALSLRTEGDVDEIVPFAEPGARTLLVKVRLPPEPRLYAGLYARVGIPAGERTRVLLPDAAIVQQGQLEQVWMAGASGAAELRVITTGEHFADGRVEVLSGLREGEQVRARQP
jgi:RND family efflux transporter MFP subunit